MSSVSIPALLSELQAAGLRPPSDIAPDALFDCVDALRRTQHHEQPGIPRTKPVRLIIDRADGITETHIVPEPHPCGPALDVWEGECPAIVRALLAFN